MNAAVDENHCNGQNDSEEPEDNGHSGVPLSDTLGKLITNCLQRALKRGSKQLLQAFNLDILENNTSFG